MNIDLLLTERNEAGLVSDQPFGSPVAGIMFDAETRQLTMEYANLETFDLNIPVEDEIAAALLDIPSLQIGVIENGQIQDNRMVPLMLLNDPDSEIGGRNFGKPTNSVTAFERFLKACVAGQPIHRKDLGDEARAGSVMGGINRAVLAFAPHLARQKTLEASHNLNMSGPSAPGMGMGGGGGRAVPPRQRPAGGRPPGQRDDEDRD